MNGWLFFRMFFSVVGALLLAVAGAGAAFGANETLRDSIYNPGYLKPVDSRVKVAVGQPAPDFSLPSVGGRRVALSDYRGRKKVVLSFVPAAWTPVCSDQWPGYNISRKYFEEYNAILIGITVDNIPTLHVWTRQMGSLWFDVLSDFWPHGRVAEMYGVLRTDGTAERALFFIDTDGVIRDFTISDINVRPPLEEVVAKIAAMP